MMNPIVDENLISFKMLEQKIFAYVCELGREITRIMLDDRQGVAIPEPGEGLVYKHMGVQESRNCTVITMRMKHRRMRWSVAGANNLAKALYRRENKDLIGTIDRCLCQVLVGISYIFLYEPSKVSKMDATGFHIHSICRIRIFRILAFIRQMPS